MKAISIITTIGNKNLSNKAIDSFEMDRNFSDVSNKFTMTIVDSPEVALVDLELYMNAGYRSIKVSYTDTGNVSTYSQFSGTIWDYTCTFVGDIKKLQVTGYLEVSTTALIASNNSSCLSFFNQQDPEPSLTTLFTGQPRLMSKISNPPSLFNTLTPNNKDSFVPPKS